MEREIRCTEIYENALALLAEPEPEFCEDYAERAPYLIAAFCCEAGGLDRAYRQVNSLETQPEYGTVYINLPDIFPLSNRFASIAASYVAAMLVLDTNEALSDKLYGRYCDRMSVICGEIPASVQSITDIYGF